MPSSIAPKLWKSFDYALCKTAGAAFHAVQFCNSFRPKATFTPKWSDKPLLKSWEKTKPTLGFPRQTDSLCPDCVKETRQAILDGRKDWRDLMNEKIGEIKAQIVERDGQVWMVKDCPQHGHYEDMMAVDASFLKWIESQFPGRDIPAHNDEELHKHGSSSVRYGRGSVLTVDLTNRCNMMCDPCFMDANQVGYVHEPTFEDTKAILDRAVSFKPKRPVIILFSGGEPTLSPYYLEAVAYAKKIGFYRILAATNGIRFAEDIEFCKAAKAAGQHGVYLQFDGVGEEKNKHRGVGNLFDVKVRAIENLASVGIKVTLVVTIVNTINNDAIGQIVEFAATNIDKVQTIAFQPVSFTGRDEDVPDAVRIKQRYTLSGMTHDLKDQLGGRMQPLRDWFPLSSYSAFTSVMDMLQGADAPWGWSSCNCHPNCGIFTLAVVNKTTGDFRSLFEFFNYEFRRTEMCVIPYGTQEGEISFCAYNTGVGWRQIIENMHKTANLADWYKDNERHAVYAAGHNVPNISKKHSLSLPIVNAIIAEDVDQKPLAVSPYLVEDHEQETV